METTKFKFIQLSSDMMTASQISTDFINANGIPVIGNVALNGDIITNGRVVPNSIELTNDWELTGYNMQSFKQGYEPVTVGTCQLACGDAVSCIGNFSVAFGSSCICDKTGAKAMAQGYHTVAHGRCSHAEGQSEGDNENPPRILSAWGTCSHAEGSTTHSIGDCSHAEGYMTESIGICSHSEGHKTTAEGIKSHVEGSGTKTTTTGEYSHAEGNTTVAAGECSHAEGSEVSAIGKCSHADGMKAVTSSDNSYCWSYGWDNYYDKGAGSYCIRPNGNTNGFYIGQNSLKSMLDNMISAICDAAGITDQAKINAIKSKIV